MDVGDKIYYMRIILAAIAGSILGIIIKPNSDQSNTISLVILVGLIVYVISHIVAKKIGKDIPKEKKGKIVTIAIFAYIFMLFTFMVMIYTVLNQHIV